MIINFIKTLLHANMPSVEVQPMDADYIALREELIQAGLSEKKLRKMDPDERVAALEQAQLDPYDYIYLAC